MCIHVCTYMCIYIYIYMHIHVCMRVYTYIYIYICAGVSEVKTHLDGAGVVNVPNRACAPMCQHARAPRPSKPFWHTQHP